MGAEGLFDAARKQPLPFLPEVIGVVTSPTGAVIRDIMHRLQARFPRRVLIWPVAVQGEKAAAEIAAAITGFNRLDGGAVPRPDLLIVARGGGSVEDLMAFNDEAVVRAAAASNIPLISAVGHETDTTLIDFAADIRAPTPTAAAELAVPVRADLLAQTLDFERRMLACFTKGLKDRQRHLAQLARILPRPETLFAAQAQRLDRASDGLVQALRRNAQLHRLAFSRVESRLRGGMIVDRMGQGRSRVEAAADRAARAQQVRLAKARQHLDGLARLLDGLSHKAVLERGFALVRGGDGAVRRRAAAVQPGEALTLTFADGAVQAVAGAGGKPVPPGTPAKSGARATGKAVRKTDQGSLF
ncbi:MAG TPA: exodeoxyribonuclease VII large subunit [Rhizomicrobium sp.]|nr:exodeoxyribonuclease VII large subunit [Rhizomicrobium sp.]